VLLAALGALAIGLSLGLLGSGGSILTVPVLHYLLGQPEKVAIAGSLLVVGVIASVAAIPYSRHRQVDWRNVAWFGIPGMAGAWLGATLAHFVPGTLQLALFAAVMLAAGWRMLRGAGMLSGLVGVGGGFLIVPALVLLAGVQMSSAVGTSLAVIAMNSYTGFAKYLGLLESQGLELDFGVLLVVAALGVAGSVAGSRLGRRLPQAVLRRIFGVFLLAMASFIVVDVAPELLAGS
jgi:uncharacterized membrane protein YfcA